MMISLPGYLMIGKLLYLCPSCYEEDTLIAAKNEITCLNCQYSFPFNLTKISYKDAQYTVSEFYQLLKSKLVIHKNTTGDIWRTSKKAVLRQGLKQIYFRGYDDSLSVIECPVVIDQGVLLIKKDQRDLNIFLIAKNTVSMFLVFA